METFNGQPFTRAYAETRQRWEPLIEVTQEKGDSETHPLLSPWDVFADFERWTNINSKDISTKNWLDRWKILDIDEITEKEAARLNYEYVRSALKLGLAQQVGLGVNPFKFGMIGSTDSHSALSTADESNYWNLYPSSDRLLKPRDGVFKVWELAAAGRAAVWATENTRGALFDAMKRRETYATTGPRMTVRFFGGWDYEKENAVRPDLALIGYRKGVPMGSDLTNAPPGKAPRFLIRAVKDPDGANLDRVQMIKGWRDGKGALREKIYNVALSGGRKEGQDGNAAPVGSTVDVKNATYTNTIGAPELAVVWQDPDFRGDELAFYYVRVLEIPTPRWTAYDAKFFGIKDIPPEVPMVTQERAYTSPIWYTPQGV